MMDKVCIRKKNNFPWYVPYIAPRPWYIFNFHFFHIFIDKKCSPIYHGDVDIEKLVKVFGLDFYYWSVYYEKKY